MIKFTGLATILRFNKTFNPRINSYTKNISKPYFMTRVPPSQNFFNQIPLKTSKNHKILTTNASLIFRKFHTNNILNSLPESKVPGPLVLEARERFSGMPEKLALNKDSKITVIKIIKSLILLINELIITLLVSIGLLIELILAMEEPFICFMVNVFVLSFLFLL